MKSQQIKALHQKSMAELQSQLQDLQQQLAKARLELAAQKLEDTSLPDRLRKDVARIKTVITEKSLADQTTNNGDK